jgi:hypothetical protein
MSQNGIILQNWGLGFPYRVLVYTMCSLFPSGILRNITADLSVELIDVSYHYFKTNLGTYIDIKLF